MDNLLRRFLAWVLAIIRHGYALLGALLGSFLLSIPSWVSPLLSQEHARRVANLATLSPHTYRDVAALFFGGGILFASFLAWNEERDALDKKSDEIKDLRASANAVAIRKANANLLAAYHELAKVAYLGETLTSNQDFERWKGAVEAWRDEVRGSLTDPETVEFDAPISPEQRDAGRQFAVLNQAHSQIRGEVLTQLERLREIMRRYDA